MRYEVNVLRAHVRKIETRRAKEKHRKCAPEMLETAVKLVQMDLKHPL